MDPSSMTGFVTCYLFIIIGLSLAFKPVMWEKWLYYLLRREFGAVYSACFTFLTGSMILINHNIWVKDPIVLITVMGWLLLFDTALLFIKPNWLAKLTPKGARLRKLIRVKGIVGTIIFGLLMIYIWPDVNFI